MNQLKITSENNETYTTVSNLFIDEYMAKAQGDYVKIYLYLLRTMQAGRQVSTSDIADHFDITEKDLCRALKYWIKEDVLRLVYDGKVLVGITLLPLKSTAPAEPSNDPFATMADFQSEQDAKKQAGNKTAGRSDSVLKAVAVSEMTAAVSDEPEIPKKQSLTAAELEKLKSDEDFSQLLYLLQVYLGKNITQTESRTLAYIYDDLDFSTELLEYLIEFCVMNNKKSVRYMEKVAISWYKDGITDVDTAKEATLNYQSTYTSVLKALGITRRNATGIEVGYIDSWHKDLGFDSPIILEACKRAMLKRPSSANFPYVNGILESWHKANVHTLSDINQLDQEYYSTRQKPTRVSAAVQASINAKKDTTAQSDRELSELSELFMEDINHEVS